MAAHDPMDERSARFDEVYTAWRRCRSQHKRSTHLLQILLREYRRIWATGDWRAQVDVLLFIRHAWPPGGERTVWSGLRSCNRNVVAVGLAVAVSCVLHERALPDARAISTLMRIAKDDANESTRFMALHVLTLARVEGLDSWLRDLATTDPSRSVRRDANVALMRAGDAAAKAALFRELREHPEHAGVAHDLWQYRHVAALTEDEDSELRAAILGAMESVRQWLRHPDRGSAWIEMLGLYAQDGLPFEDEDIELLGGFATAAREVHDRVRAVKTLAAFNTTRSREWLEQLASGGSPWEVKRCAQRALKAGRA